MKKRSVLFFLALTVSFSASALPARGRQLNRQVRSEAFSQEIPSDNCGAIDPLRACYSSSGTYLQCTAKGSLDQMCQASLVDPSTGQRICASVRSAGACQCDSRTKQATGSCQYMK